MQAALAMGQEVELLAVNHWDVAIKTHQSNHQGVRHLCQSLDDVEPRKVIPGGRLDLLMASPECTHHSNARGGKPMSDQSRSTAWHILRWCDALYVENVLIENVPEFRTWGPLGANGRPLESKKGELYRLFIAGLEALGYTVEDRILCAADYGDATTRKRLFIQARKKGRISWPDRTHGPVGGLDLTGTGKTWRPAREIIDWTLKSQSIYERKRPLADNTLRRIFAGLQKFSGLPFVLGQQSCSAPRDTGQPIPTIASAGAISLVEPFLLVFRNNCDASSLDSPLSTITTSGKHHALVEPYIVQAAHSTEGHERRCYGMGRPVPTIDARCSLGIAQPFILPNEGFFRGNVARSIEEPIPTVTQRGAGGLVEPFLVKYHGSHKGQHDGDKRTHPTDTPLPTLDTSNRIALAEPCLVNLKGQSIGRSIEQPTPTITAHAPHLYVAEPFLVGAGGPVGAGHPQSVADPVGTILGQNHRALIEPFLLAYYGNGGPQSVDDPLNTITARDRFALVSPEMIHQVDGQIVGWLDIRFRMLQPKELAAAMSFPKGYQFSGTREATVRQIGNAVPVGTAEALCTEILGAAALRRAA